jgi:ubiquinone biosynthesis UbiH/UbiF/VisC/COQ6 family hydroxylase
VALVGAAPEAPAPIDGFDARTYALSPGNVEFLRRLGAWDAIVSRAAPVHAMRIFGDDGRAELEFSAYQAGVAELAWIVEDAALQHALWRGVTGSAKRCQALNVGEREALVTFDDGSTLATRLVVGADGAHSFVRTSAGIEVRERDYEQVAVVANFRCERPHANTALQWFQGGPVLALLPLPREQVAMVWSLPAAEAARMSSLAPAGLAEEVTRASQEALGALSPASAVRSFPLRRLSARRLVSPRVALVGDAGHVVHPLAGQGLNLGLQDARVLVEVLTSREPGRDPGDYRLLRRYERRRAEPILAMDAVISGLFALYGGRSRGIGRLRNAGLNLTDRLPVLKNILIRQAMS